MYSSVEKSMIWPDDIEYKVLYESMTCDVMKEQIKKIKKGMKPFKDGSLENSFFSMNESLDPKYSKPRKLDGFLMKSLPQILIPFYEVYDSDTSFRSEKGMTLLSEREILEQNDESETVIDFAYVYVGMGHIMVYMYDRANNIVLEHVDGGANGYDRVSNHERRKEMVSTYKLGNPTKCSISFDGWFDNYM